jgi:hypothetical protein
MSQTPTSYLAAGWDESNNGGALANVYYYNTTNPNVNTWRTISRTSFHLSESLPEKSQPDSQQLTIRLCMVILFCCSIQHLLFQFLTLEDRADLAQNSIAMDCWARVNRGVGKRPSTMVPRAARAMARAKGGARTGLASTTNSRMYM